MFGIFRKTLEPSSRFLRDFCDNTLSGHWAPAGLSLTVRDTRTVAPRGAVSGRSDCQTERSETRASCRRRVVTRMACGDSENVRSILTVQNFLTTQNGGLWPVD